MDARERAAWISYHDELIACYHRTEDGAEQDRLLEMIATIECILLCTKGADNGKANDNRVD